MGTAGLQPFSSLEEKRTIQVEAEDSSSELASSEAGSESDEVAYSEFESIDTSNESEESQKSLKTPTF